MKQKSKLPHILLVDDDNELSGMLCEYLESEGLRVEPVMNGLDAVTRALSGEHDAIVLDIMLPQLNGIEVLRQIRQASEIPVLMLTAKGDQIDRVVGLELGADDYVPKPCYPRELLARLRAVLRRQPLKTHNVSYMSRGELELSVAARRATWAGEVIDLTATEFNILVALVQMGDDVATKDHLSLQGLGRVRQSYDRSVDVHISNLRLKLDAASAGKIGVETVRSVGYRLRPIA